MGDVSMAVKPDTAAVTASAAGDGLTRCSVLQPTVVSLTTRDSTGRLVSVGRTAFSTRVTTINGTRPPLSSQVFFNES